MYFACWQDRVGCLIREACRLTDLPVPVSQNGTVMRGNCMLSPSAVQKQVGEIAKLPANWKQVSN